MPPEPVVVEDFDEEVVTEEEVTVDLKVTQGKPEKVKTRTEYLAEKKAKKELLLAEKKAKKELLLAEKKAKKELKKAQKIELATYNKENNTDFKTYSAYLKHLKKVEEVLKYDAAILLNETQNRQIRKAALEVKDESVITDTNTVTSNDD